MFRTVLLSVSLALICLSPPAQPALDTLGLNGQPRDLLLPEPPAESTAQAASSASDGPVTQAAPATVSVPRLLQYQGYLTDGGGLPLPGPVALTFRLYADAFAASPVWTETQSGVALIDGVASVILGAVTPLNPGLFSGVPLYLGVSVNGAAELAPRTPLVSVPYAIRAGFAERLDTLTTGETLRLGQPASGSPGRLEVYDRDGQVASRVTYNADDAGFIAIQNPDGDHDALTLNTVGGSDGGGGSLQINNDDGGRVVYISENTLDGGVVRTYNRFGTQMAAIGSDANHNGYLSIANSGNIERVAAYIDPFGFGRIYINGSSIADVAEVLPLTSREGVEPGVVVVMDPESPGSLRLSQRPYDRLVAGVIAGAGDSAPALVLGQRSDGSTDLPLSLAGVVEVWADAEANGAITPGDLLTTSGRPGHAMRATDPERTLGAVLGKAMESLESGQALIRMLVTLQ